MRHYVIVIICLVLLACTKNEGEPERNACGVIGLGERIINGTVCSEDNSPIVQLTILFESGAIGTCSGARLTASDILTAAHCIEDIDGDSVTSVTVRVAGIDQATTQLMKHPNYAFPQNDAAIVKLASPASGATLPLATSKGVQSEDIISIYGYGVNEDADAGALRSGQMKVTGVNSQDITAEFGSEGSSVCIGDSGGPAVFEIDGNPGIVGITSFAAATSARQFCDEGSSSNFANVQGSSILSFILSTAPGTGTI